ncbi:hypothetical protein PISL3812_04740 [Talaromyces islandicus]|uniref:SRR1-like domain-containing protein n=1 Tax=Talaromyces islandicus TaxID=28573 RepID=A0A0U1LYJ4_TALIS|nr:hypothetical protein PISL3812_04740 [Talaromyces islandicus]
MPHTSRRHRNHVSSNSLRAAHGKRLQITDDDGWVHVVNTSSPASSPRSRPKTYTSPTTDGSADDPDCSISKQQQHQKEEEKKAEELPLILPAEAPPRLTLASLRQKFDADLTTWQNSATWTTLRDSLVRILASLPAGSSIDRLVCIGLGSPSGLRDGWVDRRDVASYQLAAFVSLVRVVQEQQQTSQTGEAEIIAQDPIFNTLDTQLLSSLGITVVPTPQAFSRVSAQTLLFAPGAEKRHLELVLPARPVVLFGGPLEEESRFLQEEENSITGKFLTTVQSVKLVEFGPRPEAFWRMRVYWRDLVD